MLKDIKIYNREKPDGELVEYLADLKKVLKKQKRLEEQKESKVKTNSRSYIYGIIESFKCTAEKERELKSIVDLCYNEIVAESIADDEDDIMINNNNYEYAQVYSDYIDTDNSIDKCEQKLSLVRNSRNIADHMDEKVLSWQLINEILKEANPNTNNLQYWYDDMKKYCQELGMKDIELGRKRIFSGTVRFGITVVPNVILALLFQNPYFDDSILRQAQAGIIEDLLKDNAPGIIGKVFSQPKAADINRERKEIKAKQEIVKECLTQTALLKKDYCCANRK